MGPDLAGLHKGAPASHLSPMARLMLYNCMQKEEGGEYDLILGIKY